MDEEAIDFMIQELTAFGENKSNSSQIPNLPGTPTPNIKDLAEKLRQNK
jgi:hypothetical protein